MHLKRNAGYGLRCHFLVEFETFRQQIGTGFFNLPLDLGSCLRTIVEREHAIQYRAYGLDLDVFWM